MKIEMSKGDIAEVESLLADVKNGSKRALTNALNKTLKTVQTRAAKAVGADLALTAKRIKQDFAIKKARFSDITGSFVSKGKPIGLMQYAAKQTKKGVSFKVKRAGRRKTVRHAFIAPAKNGGGLHVWWRGKIWKRPVNPKLKYGALPRKYRFPVSSSKKTRGVQRLTGPRIEDILGESTMWEGICVDAAGKYVENLGGQIEDILRRHRG
ncbi:MAG: hypothetical protein JEZ12_26595 [Desulfobacterium sp.]|nr:hypothetical protein [Desulfobacterium sp.]